MKAAFFFDTILLKNYNNDFFAMTLTYEFLKSRYLNFYDELIIATRCKSIEEYKGNTNGYRKTNGNKIKVISITEYNDIPDAIINKKKVEKQVDEIVRQSDRVIARMPSILGMFAIGSAQKYKKQYMVEMVACPFDNYMNHIRFGGKFLAPIMWKLNKKYIKEAPKVLYVTNNFLQKRYPTNGLSVSCSDVVLEENNDSTLNERLKRIESEKANIKLATIASVELKYKGQEYVIKALSKMKRNGEKYEYYLIGGGNQERLRKIAQKMGVENEVHFLGSIPHEEVFKVIDDIDLYIQPSLQEGLPRALLEAMSKACPAIGSNVGGIPELLDKKFIFRKKNINDIIRKIKFAEKNLNIMACENFKVNERYNNDTLDNKRKEFYK